MLASWAIIIRRFEVQVIHNETLLGGAIVEFSRQFVMRGQLAQPLTCQKLRDQRKTAASKMSPSAETVPLYSYAVMV